MFDNGVGGVHGVGMPGVALRDGLTELEQIVKSLSTVDAADLPGTGLGEAVVALTAHLRAVEALRGRLADRFSASGAWAAEGSRNAVMWMSGHSNEALGSSRQVLATGVWQRLYPLMGQALADGAVSIAHLRILDNTHRRYPSLHNMMHEAEAPITELARHAPPRRFESLLTSLCHRADPEAVDKDSSDRRSQCYLFASTISDGFVKVDGLLPAEVGQQFVAALESARRKISHSERPNTNADRADSFTRDLDAPREPGRVGRGRRELNVEALHRILIAATTVCDTHGVMLPSVGGARPVVHVTIPLDSLQAQSQQQAAGWLERFGVPVAAVSAAQAMRFACDGLVQPLIVDKSGRLVATLPTTRAVAPILRRAIHLRDRHCRFTGCRSRIDEVHHVVFASHGGRSTTENLVGLCWHHHQLIHHSHWTLHGDANDDLVLINTHSQQQWTSRPPPGFSQV